MESKQIAELRARLEENEIELQQNRGEISVLKKQIREKDLESRLRLNEVVALKLKTRDLQTQLHDNSLKCESLEEPSLFLSTSKNSSYATKHPKRAPNEKATSLDQHKTKRNETSSSSKSFFLAKTSNQTQNDLLCRLEEAEQRCLDQKKTFEHAKQQWAEEKVRVLKYQERLQNCYVQMHRHAKVLEEKVRHLTARLEYFEADDLNINSRFRPTITEETDEDFSLEV